MTGPVRITGARGPAIVLPGDDVDTDRIIPARFLKSVTFEGLGAHVFEDDRRQAAAAGTPHRFDRPGADVARILIVAGNFGCGSSREHAPRAIALRGIQAIVGVSFAEIFFSNAVAIGLPCVSVSREDQEALAAMVEGDPRLGVEVDLEALEVRAGDRRVPASLPEVGRQALLTGQWDAAGMLLDRYTEVEAVRARLPYLTDPPFVAT